MKLLRVWLALALLGLMGLGVARLGFDVEILNLLPETLPVARGLKTYQRHFSDARELIITVEGAAPDEAEVAARALARVLRSRTDLVTDVMWQPGWLENPAQSAELIAFLWLNQPRDVFGELTNRLSPTNLPGILRDARERLATSFSPRDIAVGGYDPYGLMTLPDSISAGAPEMGTGDELFASPDGTFRLVFVEAKPNIISYRACRVWLTDIQQAIVQAQAEGEIPSAVQLQFTGRPAFVTEIAGGMENDMAGSACGTLAIIGILFWLTHRRLRPLIWLLFLLVAILAGTTALSGLILGTINVVSMGFAAILLGLAEDFGIVIYQETRSHPELTGPELRREVGPGIFWSAVTTSGAFLMLNLSVLPGLGQLGTLVAIGILLAAVVMLFGFIPPLLRIRRKGDMASSPAPGSERFLLFTSSRLIPRGAIWVISVVALLASAGLLWKEGPRFDHSPNVLKPKNSEANAALEKIKTRFGRQQEPLWVMVPGRNEAEVAQRLTEARQALTSALSNQLISSFTLPVSLWPQPENQLLNRPAAAMLVQRREALRSAAMSEGFNANSLSTTESMLDSWERATVATNVFWPTNRESRWIFRRIVARSTNGFLALGFIHPAVDSARTKKLLAEWPESLEQQGIILSGWELLGSTVFDLVVKEMPRVILPIFCLVVLSLWLAFRNVKEAILSVLTLAFSGVCLGALMNLLGWDWNILNLMALPLLLGMGVDFSIHIQLALRRYDGDLLAVRRSVARALLLAGATTIAGFVSLTFSTNSGMASLGRVCAVGIGLALVTAVYLLPVWWKAWIRPATESGRGNAPISGTGGH